MTTELRLTREQAAEKFGAPPEGKRFLLKDGHVLLDKDNKPILLQKKMSRKRDRQKSTMQQYVVPVGKLRSATLEGFDISLHKKPRQTDFQDPLHFLQFNVWWHKQHIEQLEKEIESLINLGKTAEERKIPMEIQRLQRQIDMLKKKQAVSK